MKKFDPTRHQFVKLRDFQFPGGVDVFEFRNHSTADGAHDFLRLNVYLSKDGDFVCIWHGLLEPAIAESLLMEAALPPDFDLFGTYNVDLFRGYLEADDIASVVLKSLRIGGKEYSAQRLRVDARDGLTCEAVAGAHAAPVRNHKNSRYFRVRAGIRC